MKTVYKDVEDYINKAPSEVRPILTKFRQVVKAAAPEADERISYQLPAYYLNGPLVYFGAFKHHVSLFGTSSISSDKYKDDLAGYKTSKGTVQFPLNQPIPWELIAKLVKQRVKENESK